MRPQPPDWDDFSTGHDKQRMRSDIASLRIDMHMLSQHPIPDTYQYRKKVAELRARMEKIPSLYFEDHEWLSMNEVMHHLDSEVQVRLDQQEKDRKESVLDAQEALHSRFYKAFLHNKYEKMPR